MAAPLGGVAKRTRRLSERGGAVAWLEPHDGPAEPVRGVGRWPRLWAASRSEPGGTVSALPWSVGSATGIGSLPGTDVVEALRIVFGEVPLPYLPELPARGPGADLVGRTAGLLVDLPVDLYAGRWRAAARPGRDLRRTADLWERDLDALTEQAEGYAGPLKVQAAGPWTLAAALQLPVGGALLHDAGAIRDLTASLAEGLAGHVAEVRRRVPGAAAGVPVVVHCCAPAVPVALVRSTGAVGVALDLSLVSALDPLGEVLDAGFGLFAGAFAAVGPPPDPDRVAGTVRELWSKLGLPADRLPEQVVVTAACGAAGASPADARAGLRTAREAARRLLD